MPNSQDVIETRTSSNEMSGNRQSKPRIFRWNPCDLCMILPSPETALVPTQTRKVPMIAGLVEPYCIPKQSEISEELELVEMKTSGTKIPLLVLARCFVQSHQADISLYIQIPNSTYKVRFHHSRPQCLFEAVSSDRRNWSITSDFIFRHLWAFDNWKPVPISWKGF
jgi:hypothetical protein